jgi:polyhydroxybutyrate depolymerase
LFDVILERVTSVYCVDLDAVYVIGHSLGASFANSLGCARAHRIRGVASVAGGITPSECSGQVAALLLHNPRDRAVPLSEGQRARDVLLGHPRAEEKPVRRSVGTFECQLYGDKDNPLFWCLHAQDATAQGRFYPHQWPTARRRQSRSSSTCWRASNRRVRWRPEPGFALTRAPGRKVIRAHCRLEAGGLRSLHRV